MKNALHALKTSLLLTLLFTAIFCILYPCITFSIGHLLFPKKAAGSLIHNAKGALIGSELIAQRFTEERYFHPRPSTAGDNGYDGLNSGGPDLGPTSKVLKSTLLQRAKEFRKTNGLPPNLPLPPDAITDSASGLDPHISPKNAELQAARVARARGIDVEYIKLFIEEAIEPPFLALFGKERVNVLKLNIALDENLALPK